MGFLDNLLPGDHILADRGFNVQESVGLHCAEIKIPPFTRGRKQLSAVEVLKLVVSSLMLEYMLRE